MRGLPKVGRREAPYFSRPTGAPTYGRGKRERVGRSVAGRLRLIQGRPSGDQSRPVCEERRLHPALALRLLQDGSDTRLHRAHADAEQLLDRREPVEHRHPDIHQGDVRPEFGGELHGLRAVRGLLD